MLYLHLRTKLMASRSQLAACSATQYWSISACEKNQRIVKIYLIYFIKRHLQLLHFTIGILTSVMEGPHIRQIINNRTLSSAFPAAKQQDTEIYLFHLN